MKLRKPFILVASASIVVGCSSRPRQDEGPEPYPEPILEDSAYFPDNPPWVEPETGVAETIVEPPPRCDQPLPSDFACAPVAAKKGQTVCTEEMLQKFAACFGADGDSVVCADAQKTYPSCAQCVLKDWIYDSRYIDIGACMSTIDPSSKCGDAWRCDVDCVELVCGECDDTPGSGSSPGTTSERDECEQRARGAAGSGKPEGACYALASRELDLCRLNLPILACFVDKKEDVLRFYRGACRDGGDWSKSGS